MAKGFGNKGSGGGVVAAFTLMDVLEDGNALRWLDAALKDTSRAALDEFSVDDRS